MLNETRVGNIVNDTRRSREFTFSKDGYKITRENTTFPVYDSNAKTEALITIGNMFTETREEFSKGRMSPILVRLLQLDLSKEIRTKEDLYFLGRKHFSEDYGGELWIHTSRVNKGEWKIEGDIPGDLTKYRNHIEIVMGRIPYDSKWKTLDDVLSFIDGMRKK